MNTISWNVFKAFIQVAVLLGCTAIVVKVGIDALNGGWLAAFGAFIVLGFLIQFVTGVHVFIGGDDNNPPSLVEQAAQALYRRFQRALYSVWVFILLILMLALILAYGLYGMMLEWRDGVYSRFRRKFA